MTEEDGIITKQLLKSKSGEFDLESIHTIKICDAGVCDLGCLGECTALRHLDLSYNHICRLHKLASLTALTHLNLSANRITALDGLQALENLQSVNVAGNLIGSLDSLRCLGGLEHLSSIRLQDQVSGLTNPMCNTPYVDKILIMFQVLTTLDGQRIRGKGSELFELCKSMDKALKDLTAVKSSEASETKASSLTPTTQQWVVDTDVNKDKVIDAEENLKAMLLGCKQLSKKAAEMLREGHEEIKPQEPS